MDAELRALLVRHKPALLALLARGERGVPSVDTTPDAFRLLGMPLDVFARYGQPIEIRVPWWADTLFFVPDVRHAELLWNEGITRGRGA